jgi:Bacterial Ig-like domain (group 3)
MMLHRNRPRIFLLAFALLGMVMVASPVVQAATFIIVNNDPAGVGFNDPTPVAPVGGNPGTTLGAQRQNAFQFAANIWSGLLSSPVPIRVGATFGALTPCTSTYGVLGQAGPIEVFRDFPGAPTAATFYASAEANSLNGADLDPAMDDISAQFNSNIGTAGCLTTLSWYLGTDSSPPAGTLDFVSVLVHELGHGLGFLTFVDLASGTKFYGLNDTFMLSLENHGAIPSDYPSMTNAQRVAASINTPNLHWVGAHVRAASGVLSAGKVGDHVQMYAPNPQESGSSVSHWDTALTPNQVMEPSYTGALHNPVLELPLFQDIGWTLLATPTTTTLSSSSNPVAFGASVTLTATVTGTAPTGTVNFKDGGIDIGGCVAVALVGAGNVRSAACSSSSLSVGTHSIVAGYSGDASNAASSSAALLQSVKTSAVSKDLVFTPLTPCRIMDTRGTAWSAAAPLTASTDRPFDITAAAITVQGGVQSGGCGVPVVARAISVNITVVSPAAGWLYIWPDLSSLPNASIINFNGSSTGYIANAAVVAILPPNPAAHILVAPAGTTGTHVVMDVLGYFAPPFATALACTTQTAAINFAASNSTVSVSTPACPAGSTLTGGGMDSNFTSANFMYYESAQNGASWTCRGRNVDLPSTWSGTCYAICCKIPGR